MENPEKFNADAAEQRPANQEQSESTFMQTVARKARGLVTGLMLAGSTMAANQESIAAVKSSIEKSEAENFLRTARERMKNDPEFAKKVNAHSLDFLEQVDQAMKYDAAGTLELLRSFGNEATMNSAYSKRENQTYTVGAGIVHDPVGVVKAMMHEGGSNPTVNSLKSSYLVKNTINNLVQRLGLGDDLSPEWRAQLEEELAAAQALQAEIDRAVAKLGSNTDPEVARKVLNDIAAWQASRQATPSTNVAQAK